MEEWNQEEARREEINKTGGLAAGLNDGFEEIQD